MKKQKGGIETILATIILAGLVIALIIAVILPMTNDTKQMGETGKTLIGDLEDSMTGKEDWFYEDAP